MEIILHSLIRILLIWLLVSSTFGDIALQPGFEPTGQFRHLAQNIPPSCYYYPASQANLAYQQPYNGQYGQTPVNYQSNLRPPSYQPNPWNGYMPYAQFGQPGLPGSPPNFPVAPNQLPSRGLDAELQRSKELQQKLSAQMSGFIQSNSGQLPPQTIAPNFPGPNVPYIPYLFPYMQPPSIIRSYRSLPILQSRGYQIIRLQDLQNAQQDSWSNPMDSRHDSGVNSQTYNSQHHKVATNSAINSSQFDLNTSDFNKKVDDHIVGSPLQIYRSQSLFSEQHHPVEIVKIPDDFFSSKNNSKKDKEEEEEEKEGKIDMTLKSPQNVSKILDQMTSNSSNSSNSIKNFSEETKSHKDYAVSSETKNNDRPTSKAQFSILNQRSNYNQPQVFEAGSQRSYNPQMDLMNSQASKVSTMPDYQRKTDNEFYNSYRHYSPSSILPSQKFPFTTYNYDNPYKTATNAINKGSLSWQRSDSRKRSITDF